MKKAAIAGHKTTFGRTGSKRTSIGRSRSSRPKDKHRKRCHKTYRGQGFP